MNLNSESAGTSFKSATTERKAGRARKSAAGKATGPAEPTTPATATSDVGTTPTVGNTLKSATSGERKMNTQAAEVLNAATNAKFVLFGIARTDRVANGPVMRGFVEIKSEGNSPPAKVNVAAWLKIGRNSGSEYLSLKVGNNSAETPEDFTVGPFYGRLFRQIEGTRTRYFGFIEDAEKTGEDENGQGTYATHWQLRVNAKPAVSNDGKTHYITGGVMASQHQEEEESPEDSNLPF